MVHDPDVAGDWPRFLVYVTYLGPAIVLLAIWQAVDADALHEVRYGWMDAAPAVAALVAVVGAALVRRAPRAFDGFGMGLVGGALSAMFIHLVVVVALPLRAWEAPFAKVWPLLDLAGLMALPTLALVKARMPPWAVPALGAAIAARLAYHAWVQPTPLRLVGLAAGVALVGLALWLNRPATRS